MKKGLEDNILGFTNGSVKKYQFDDVSASHSALCDSKRDTALHDS